MASRVVISDVGRGYVPGLPCMAAALNVYINARLLQDEAIAQTCLRGQRKASHAGVAACDTVIEKVEAALCRH